MNVKRGLRLAGIITLILGIVITPLSMTGFVIAEGMSSSITSIIGLILIVGSLLLFTASKG